MKSNILIYKRYYSLIYKKIMFCKIERSVIIKINITKL